MVRFHAPGSWLTLATVLVVVAAVAQGALEHAFDGRIPVFLCFYPAVAFAGWSGGLVPGVLATLLSLAIANYAFAPPAGFGIADEAALVSHLVFLAMGTAFAGAGEAALRTRARLLAADRELRAALSQRDEFISIAAHELRTPLTALVLQLDSLVKAMPPEDERVGRKLDTARRQTARLAALIEELLSVGRISTGRLQLELAELDLAALVRDVAAQQRAQAEHAGSTLTVDVPATVVGRWDAARLEQVLSNLLGNAIKYGAGRPITIELAADADRAVLRVRDRGIGIPPDELPRIFDRFARAVSVRNFGGLGLGLYIAREIVEAHGGTIAATSTPGEGATFTVTLPRGGAASSAS